MSALDFDRTTLDPRDFSFEGQLADFEAKGWELEEPASADPGASFRYLLRHRRIGEIERLFEANGQWLRFFREDDGTWKVEILPRPIVGDPTIVPDSGVGTALEAAEAAQNQLGSGS